jgi:aspartate 1-decarboxylase
MLIGKIHCCHVTGADLNYSGSISIDLNLLKACGFLPNQEVEIWNVTNGNRFSTYVIPSESPAGSGEITLNGSAARQVAIGDKLIIAGYCEVDIPALFRGDKTHTTYVALVENEENQLRKQFKTFVRAFPESEIPPDAENENTIALDHPELPAGWKLCYTRQYLVGY